MDVCINMFVYRAVLVPVVVSARMTLLLSPIFLLLTSGHFVTFVIEL